jgi:organic radical activating enzyme
MNMASLVSPNWLRRVPPRTSLVANFHDFVSCFLGIAHAIKQAQAFRNGFMYGNNPIRPPVTGDGSTLDVQAIFYTLQGEGPYAGWPAVFVRLGGCNLACDFCDTEFEQFKPHKTEDIVATVKAKAGNATLVVITGGEPLRQPIELFCKQLIENGFTVQIETNGTLWRELPAEVDVICSPKNKGKGYMPIRPDVLGRATALKFIISASRPGYQAIGDVGQDKNLAVYVQPMDEYDAKKNADNLKLATDIALQQGCRLSLQLHKIAGIE